MPPAPVATASDDAAKLKDMLDAIITFFGLPAGTTAEQVMTTFKAMAAKALAAHPALQMVQRVPLARKWLILMPAWQGWSHARIARTVRTSNTTVRRHVKDAAG